MNSPFGGPWNIGDTVGAITFAVVLVVGVAALVALWRSR